MERKMVPFAKAHERAKQFADSQIESINETNNTPGKKHPDVWEELYQLMLAQIAETEGIKKPD